MTRLRCRNSTALAIVLALSLTQPGRTQPRNDGPVSFTSRPSRSADPASADSAVRSYRIYALDELGGDPGFGEWIAQTVPEVIATGTWKGPGVIRYYAPKNILVVCHTPAVQAKVDEFLKDMKQSLPDANKANAAARKSSTRSHEVVPASYRAPTLLKASSPPPESSLSYPVPVQPKTPKHLFHFIIRYEGEGIIDDNVVKMMKEYNQAQNKGSETASAAPATACAAPVLIVPRGASPVAVPMPAAAPTAEPPPGPSPYAPGASGSPSTGTAYPAVLPSSPPPGPADVPIMPAAAAPATAPEAATNDKEIKTRPKSAPKRIENRLKNTEEKERAATR